MKKIKYLLVCLMLMILISGCQNKQMEASTDEGSVSSEVSVEIKKESTPDTIEDDQYDWISDSERLGYDDNEVFDGMASKHQHDVEFVAAKVPGPDYIRWYFDVEGGEGVYYEYYMIGATDTYYKNSTWMDTDLTELTCGLQDGELAYVKANTTFWVGGIAESTILEFEEIKECRKISMEEAANLIEIADLYECEIQYWDGFSGLARHTKMDGYLFSGYIDNRYKESEEKANCFVGEVAISYQGEVIGLYNRLEFVGDYLVFYHHEGEWSDTSRPEYVTVEDVEEILDTGKLYNDYMFVLSY